MDHPGHGPTVSRLRLGVLLRTGRETAGVTGRQAADRISSSHSKISRMERGLLPVRVSDVAGLLDLYGIDDEERRDLALTLAAESTQPSWWDPFTGDLPPHLVHYLNVEAAATRIVIYDPVAIPALLQTEAYSQAVTRSMSRSEPRTWRAGLREETLARRKQVLRLSSPPYVWALIDEAVLHRAPGRRRGVLAGQLAGLVEAVEGGGVAVQVIPAAADVTLTATGPFSILRFQAAELPDLVVLEQITTFATLDRRADVERYLIMAHLLAASAYGPDESLQLIRRLRDQARQDGRAEHSPGSS